MSASNQTIVNQTAEAERVDSRSQADAEVLSQLLEQLVRLEREVQQIRIVLDRPDQLSLTANLGSFKSRLATSAKRTISFLMPRRAKAYFRRRRVALLHDSGLFDATYYLSQNPDVLASGCDPLEHYLSQGAQQGRDPHEMFDTSYYVDQNPDVVASGTNALLHFSIHGFREDRRPHPMFTARQYRAAVERSLALRTAPSPGKKQQTRLPLPLHRSQDLPQQFRPVALQSSAKTKVDGVGVGTTHTLVVCHVLPFPPRAGNEYRIHRLVQWLRSIGHEVYVVVSPLPGEILDPEAKARAALEYPNLVICERDGTVSHQSENHQVDELLRGLAQQHSRSGVTGSTSSLETVFCPDYLTDLLLLIDERLKPEIVVCNYVFMSRFLPKVPRRTFKIIDTHDVFSTKSNKVSRFGISGDIELTGDEESKLLDRADLIVAIQPDEARELRALVPSKPVVTAGVDFLISDRAYPLPTEPVVLCVGSRNALNVKGVSDFLSLAWPLIRRRVPGARLLIAGPVCEALDHWSNVGDGVELLGRRDSLDPVYAQARVVVNPAVAGTGLKIKTLEALAHLRPVVAWPSGVDGVSSEFRRQCKVASDWYQFSRQVVLLLSGDRPSDIVEQRETIKQQLSADVVYGALRAAIEEGLRKVQRDDPVSRTTLSGE